jgi:hypothetical protein
MKDKFMAQGTNTISSRGALIFRGFLGCAPPSPARPLDKNNVKVKNVEW